MFEDFCHKKLQEFSATVTYQPTFMLFMCVLNCLFSATAVLGNMFVIYALWKASSIPGNLKKLFVSLAFSDLAVGLCVQPMFSVVVAVMLNMTVNETYDFDRLCPSVVTLLMASSWFTVGASFFTTAAIALDRYLAVFLHLRYRELVTEKRVNIALISLWVTNVLGTTIFVVVPSHNEMAAFVYTLVNRIFKVVRYHQNQIQDQCQFQNQERIAAARERKSVTNAFYVYITPLICYLPNIIASILLEVDNTNMFILVANFVSVFFLYLNSTFNPFVYCWRYREVRNIVKNTINKLCVGNHIRQ